MSFVRSFTAPAVIFGEVCLALIPSAAAQQPLPATTVQLPTFSQFTITTTVSVPDRGGAYLGGLNSGASNSSRLGPGPIHNRSLSSSRTASGISVSATIIDHDELDRAILAEAASKRGAVDTTAVRAAAISKAVEVASRPTSQRAASSRNALPGSVAAIRQQNASTADLEAAEVAGYLAKGRQAEAEHKPAVAKVFYQMVARRDNGPMKKEATERLASLTRGN